MDHRRQLGHRRRHARFSRHAAAGDTAGDTARAARTKRARVANVSVAGHAFRPLCGPAWCTAIAYELHARGARIVLSARRESELERVREGCVRGDGTRDHRTPARRPVLPPPPAPAILVVDLEATAALRAAADEAQRLLGGPVQVLINNGGIGVRATAMETQLAVEQRVMAVNFTAPCELTRAVLPGMVDAGEGHIVVVSSVQGRVALPDRSAYSASKHALHGYFNALRCEVAPAGVRVVLVLPGYVATSLSLNALRSDGTRYNHMDESTRRGYPPELVARRVADGVAHGRREIWIMQLSGRLAIYAAFLVPALLDRVLSARRH